MGEIADQMINGECCELCLSQFENPQRRSQPYEHGYPVVCYSCWNNLTEKEKEHHQVAQAPTVSY